MKICRVEGCRNKGEIVGKGYRRGLCNTHKREKYGVRGRREAKCPPKNVVCPPKKSREAEGVSTQKVKMSTQKRVIEELRSRIRVM